MDARRAYSATFMENDGMTEENIANVFTLIQEQLMWLGTERFFFLISFSIFLFTTWLLLSCTDYLNENHRLFRQEVNPCPGLTEAELALLDNKTSKIKEEDDDEELP